ncbi:MAG: hypothetical protein ACK553_05870 [Planctomycetota bacterium]|jgi:hypothetical protein
MTKLLPRAKVRADLHRLLIRFGIDTRKKRLDRVVLEQVIFPELQRGTRMHSILFVGCAWYTLHYPWVFRDKDFRTMEIDPDAACFGADKHLVGSCESLGTLLSRGELDCVILNGVFGFGLNTPDGLNRTLQGIHHALRAGGLLIFGWNDLPAHAPFPPFSVEGWHCFEPYRFPPLKGESHASDLINRHSFHFFLNRPSSIGK